MADTPGDQPAIERRNSLKGVTLGGAAALAGTEARAPGAAESDFFSQCTRLFLAHNGVPVGSHRVRYWRSFCRAGSVVERAIVGGVTRWHQSRRPDSVVIAI
jgi:hypothetical protein